MKKFTSIITLLAIMVFAVTSSFAQNTFMTKAQTLGLKSSTPIYNLPTETASRTVFLEEGFDIEGDFPPTGWSQDILNADYTWEQGNEVNNNFNTIDPNSLFSALVEWVAADQDEWLKTPVITAPNEEPLTLNFYAGVSGAWLTGATLICHISTDGWNTSEELWNAIDVIDPAADWAWNFVSVDISEYSSSDFEVAWQYVGNDGDLAGLDGVSIQAGYEYIYQDDFESWAVGEYLVENDVTGFWDTWSSSPGTAEDALVSDAQSLSPDNSVHIDGTTDLVLKLGDKTSGAYMVNVAYYIPSTFGGYINIQHFEAPGIEWACEVYFGSATGDENGYMYAGDPAEIPFTFPHDEWFPISFEFDLDEDLAACYINGAMIAEWQFSLQAQGDAGTLQLGGVNIYAGAPTGETPDYYFDNIEYIVIDAGISNPIIDVDPTSMFLTLEEGQSTTEMVTISNTGQEDLEYDIVTVYPFSGKALQHAPAGANTPKVLNQDITKAPKYTPNNNTNSTRDQVLNYDGDNSSAIGSTGGDYEWRLAAMFPSDMLAPYIGMEINEIHVYINDPGIQYFAQVYGMGSFNTPGPGDLLMEQEFFAEPAAWNYIYLDDPVYVDGQDLWVGYWVSSTAGSFTPGCDAGPADPNGDWLASGPGWSHLSDNPELDFNWNIRANLTGDPITQWLSADPTSGLLMQDESVNVDVTIDAGGLVSNTYSGKLLVRNNDPTNEEVAVSVTLGVIVGVGENGENEFVAVYPNPASTMLSINSNGDVKNVTLVNTIGQVVYNNTSANSIDISNFERGVYFITIDTENGTTTQKVLIQ
ncbi:MAG: T9SS type A sorting domain-containing protein [Bacteroidales bacterium]|jgi:hypothetical protein|nr:T9SS type A sorting domain-containing protein [Bacteroidales bacterium]